MGKILGLFLGVVLLGTSFVGGWFARGPSDDGVRELAGRLTSELDASRRDVDKANQIAGLATAARDSAENKLRGAELKLESIFGGVKVIEGLVADTVAVGADAQSTLRKVIANWPRITQLIRSILALK